MRNLLLLSLLLTTGAVADDGYADSVRAWHARRLASLRKSDGWLSLAGLYWLKPGLNSFGSAPSSALVFPKGPSRLGTYRLEGNRLTLQLEGEEPEAVDLSEPEGQTTWHWGSLSWYLIQREGRIGIRLKDSESAALREFRGIPTFPIRPEWCLSARLESDPGTVGVTSVLGGVTATPSPGWLVFDKGGRTYRLRPVLEDGETDYFLIFADATTGHETYPTGRFLYAHPPGPDGRVTLDFNRAYNPPCSFSPYATCPLPPACNRLDLRIEAGELDRGHGGLKK